MSALRTLLRRAAGGHGADLRHLARGAGALLGANVVVAVLGIVQTGVLTRGLGLAGYGRLALILALGGVATRLLSLGIADLVVRYLGEWDDDLPRARALLRLALTCALANAGLIFALLFAGAPLLARHAVGDPGAAPALRLWAVSAAAVSTCEMWLGVLRVRGRFGRLAGIKAAEAVVKLGATLVLFRSAPSLQAAVTALSVSSAVYVAAVAAVGVAALRPAQRAFLTAPFGALHGAWRGIRTLLANLWWGTTFKTVATEVDQVLLGLIATAEAVGLYRLCLQLIGMIGLLRGPLTEVVYPAVVRKVVTGTRAEARRYVRTLSLVFGSLALAIGAAGFLAAPWLVSWVAGPAFAPAATGFRIMIWADVVTLAVVWRQAVAVGADRSRVMALSWLATAVVWYAGAPLLVPRFGFPAAAALYAASRLASHFLFVWMLRGALDDEAPGRAAAAPAPLAAAGARRA